MNSDITIREINMNDKAIIQDFFAVMGEESALFFNVGHGNENRIMRFFDGTLQNHKIWISTADDDNGNEICTGIVFLYDADRKIPWLGVAVRDGYQGKHIGSSLIEYVKDYAEKSSLGGIILITAQNNYKGQRLYEKCGFIREGVHNSGEYLYICYFNN